jgi:hypothetical protein
MISKSGETDTLYRIFDNLNRANQSATMTAKLANLPINSLDISQKLTIYLNCVVPLGGFAFALKLPESVSQSGNVVLGESASALLLACDKKSDTLKIIGYSLSKENLPSGYVRLLEIPLRTLTSFGVNDFEILGADFSDGQGRKIEVAYSLSVENEGGNDGNGFGQPEIVSNGVVAYPNPFNSSVSIRFALPQTSNAVVEIYDVLGRRVRTLTEGLLAKGEHSLVWNGQDYRGETVATGVYLCRTKMESEELVLKLNYMK